MIKSLNTFIKRIHAPKSPASEMWSLMKSNLNLLLLITAALVLTSCLSYSHALGRGWSNEPSSVAARVDFGVLDVATSPIQAVAVPVIYLSEQRRHTDHPARGKKK